MGDESKSAPAAAPPLPPNPFKPPSISTPAVGSSGFSKMLSLHYSVRTGISILVLVGFFAMLGLLLSGAVQDLGDIKAVVFTLLGALGAAFTQVVQYWLGSSKDSADKTDLLMTRGGA